MSDAPYFADCSSNNPMPNIAAYAFAGHTDLCRKVSEGVGYHWVEGDQVADQAHAAGLRVGSYHWLRPDSSATAQAAFFVSLVKPHAKPGDWLMTDFERTADAADPADVVRAAQLHEFNEYVTKHLPGVPLYVYTGNWYLDDKPHCQAECRRWPVVMSDYSGAAKLPNPYRLRYVAWQFTDHARVPGFAAPVDYNRWIETPTKEFTMDAAAEKRFAALEAKAAATDAKVDKLLVLAERNDHPHTWEDANGDARQARTWLHGIPGFKDPAAVVHKAPVKP